MNQTKRKDWPVCPECQFEINPARPYHQQQCSKGMNVGKKDDGMRARFDHEFRFVSWIIAERERLLPFIEAELRAERKHTLEEVEAALPEEGHLCRYCGGTRLYQDYTLSKLQALKELVS